MMGAYRLYLTDRDEQGFKLRLIHKCLGSHLGTAGANLTRSAEEGSSNTTAGFNRSLDYLSRFSRGSTGPQAAMRNNFMPDRPGTHARF